MLWILSIRVSYIEDKIDYSVKLFGYPLFTSDPEITKQRAERRKHKESKRQLKEEKKRRQEMKKNLAAMEKDLSDNKVLHGMSLEEKEEKEEKIETGQEQQASFQPVNESSLSSEEIKEETEGKPRELPTSVNRSERQPSRLKLIIRKVLAVLQKLVHIARSIPDKLRCFWFRLVRFKSHLTLWKEFLLDETMKTALLSGRGYILQVFRHILPGHLNGTIRFGFDDPSITGELLGALGALIPLYKDKFKVEPYFDQSIFELELYAKGRIRFIKLLSIGLHVLFDKQLMGKIKEVQSRLGGK